MTGHNFDFETQYEVVVRAGLLPAKLVSVSPLYMGARDQDFVSGIFNDLWHEDPDFRVYLADAQKKIEDRIDVARSREEKRPNWVDEVHGE